MTTTTTPNRNGVPTEKLFATIGKLKEQPELAAFRFTARNKWQTGTHSTSTIHDWHGVGTDHEHVEEFSYSADHPTLGTGNGPTPQEFLLHALAACITGGVATIAAAKKIDLTSVESTVEGDIDVQGVLGIDPEVRNGFSAIRASFRLVGDASAEELRDLVRASVARSAIYDMVVNGTTVSVDAVA